MQYSTLFVSLLISTAMAAKGDGISKNGTLTEEQTCKEMLGLNALVQLANNQTKLDAITENNATRAQAIKDKASAASTKLTELQSNSTLMSHCTIIDAAIMTNATCTKQFLLQKFVDFAANETLVSKTVSNDMKKVADIQRKASSAASKLQQLKSNATLQAACPAVFMADECKMVVALKKFADLGMNSTKVEKLAQGNTTKEADIKAAASVAGMQVLMLEANSTLMAECKSIGILAKGGSADTTQESTTPSGSKSAASNNSMSFSALLMGVLALAMATL